jgi:hypothetical protein
VILGNNRYFALADLDRILLVRASDGSVRVEIQLLGVVIDVTSPEPGTVYAIVTDAVVFVEIDQGIAAEP